ncbi:DUF2157 domain-containing protein [Sphingobium chlorophenolicum]|uniref:DUF2157 domain-containing protein n=1 Tax=Sphingobium chlorophenolicum TaxID=46429 RepID=A0A081RDZ1_SPHCR|nr:DUF2157 domain-containing protein [Sphingobium chlorophenolicum]KEQ53414.1 putative uncharacterized protein precursor [Sphingobium chlorophenolicum]
MSERQLKAWQDAGLIDAGTAGRIREWEAAHHRPLGLWAIIGLGALAIGLGIVSVVAANWDAISGETRLAIHFALMVGLAGLLWRYLPDAAAKNDYFNDGALFVAAVLGLSFFGHIGQVYQTSSPLWQPLLVWLVIFSPLLLLFGRGWPVAGLWLAGVLGTAWSHADEYGRGWLWGQSMPQPAWPTLYWGLIATPPMAVAALAAFMRGRSDRPGFWRLLEQLAMIVILTGVSIAIIAGGWDSGTHHVVGSAVIRSLALAGTAAVIWAFRQGRSGQATAGILAVAAVLHVAQALLLGVEGATRGPWIGALFFLLLWSAVAAGALFARWRRLFQGAIALLALRIIILSFELNDDLLGSGAGLILSGAFAMAVAWGTVRISRRYAPAERNGE